jgi:asparagine synthase (glutamine-hydrolysing)
VCGIAGFVSLGKCPHPAGRRVLGVMSALVEHRGPDGEGTWLNEDETCGMTHRRLSIIDLSPSGSQPMSDCHGNTIVFNGEIYNFKELRATCEDHGYRFRSNSDTEVVLALYLVFGNACVDLLRGMFAFAIWNSASGELFAARDRFGIKPFYFTTVDDVFYFASEAKAILPFLKSISTDEIALAEYLTFQYQLGSETLFKNVFQIQPAHLLRVSEGRATTHRYWDVRYDIQWGRSTEEVRASVRELLKDSVSAHMVGDVEIGAYLSGGIDSSVIADLASGLTAKKLKTFNGRFTEYPGYDESHFARLAANRISSDLFVCDINANDFRENIRKIVWHLDYPVAGPGSLPQYMVSNMAAKQVKVVLGGQGGDEIFGGYARYLVAYLEQCLKAAIDGTAKNGNFVVTIESIIPNLGVLSEYKPLLQEFWRDGLFGPLDERFLRLIDRSKDVTDEVKWNDLDQSGVYERFYEIFNNPSNVAKEAYFDSMTHFEIKTLLPALLQVEDRMSMAHGLESRVPFLDHKLVEYVAGVPADVKFTGGQLKQLLRTSFTESLPSEILDRRDKMGFPVPLKEWFSGELNEFVKEVFSNSASAQRDYIDSAAVLKNFESEAKFSRKTWALLSLELWQQEFHDRASQFRNLAR